MLPPAQKSEYQNKIYTEHFGLIKLSRQQAQMAYQYAVHDIPMQAYIGFNIDTFADHVQPFFHRFDGDVCVKRLDIVDKVVNIMFLIFLTLV